VSRSIDLMHLGFDRVICAYEVDGLIVDPGPERCLERLLAELEGPPRGLLLTHIHLDHAGASGSLVRRFPELPVYVHERGAPHMIDPSRLLVSAEKLYGDQMDRLWGAVEPVPERNLRVLRGGERVEGFEVLYTPGHAYHHVSYLHEASGDAYVGDVAGVRLPPWEFTVPPTPPPDIDVEAWHASLEALEERAPSAVCLTHFGRVDDAEDQLARMHERLDERAALARANEREPFLVALREEVHAAGGAEMAERLERAAGAAELR
jgi:glyoxylase-like metal-dependent hydrolase (beta-lactamase superfamily II)